MPTPDHAPSAALVEKILAEALPLAASAGWTETVYRQACAAAGVLPADAAYALPKGIESLVPAYLEFLREELDTALKQEPLGEMRIREKVTRGVEIWFDKLSEHPRASVRALDWAGVRPMSPASLPKQIWNVADAIWSGIGDDSTGFTFASKRTTLSAVLTSTLAVWRQAPEDKAEWKGFLDRRIEDVMAFEKFKASIKFPLFA